MSERLRRDEIPEIEGLLQRRELQIVCKGPRGEREGTWRTQCGKSLYSLARQIQKEGVEKLQGKSKFQTYRKKITDI